MHDMIFWRLVIMHDIMLWTGGIQILAFCFVRSHTSITRHKVRDNKKVRVAILETCHNA